MSPQISGLGEPIGQITIGGKIPIGGIVNPKIEAEFGTPLPAPKTLVDGTFEGGGTLGAAYAGALLALARNKIWFKRVAGNSAGAITASLIAAGYDANEIDFLFTPADTNKNRPSNLPATVNQNAIDYRRFVDFPTSAADISPETKKNHLIYKLVKGAILDEIRESAIDLPAIAPMVDAIVNKVLARLPSQVGPFDWTIPEKTVEVGPFNITTPDRKIGYKGLSVPVPGISIEVGPFRWTIPGEKITVGPVPLSLTDSQKKAIRDALVEALRVYPTRLSLSQLNFINTEALRTEFANKFVDEALNIDPFYRLFLNFVGDGGAFKGDVFLSTMKRLLETKVNNNLNRPSGTPVKFQDLPIDLAVIAADTTDHKMVIYSQEFSADMEVAEAVRRSMSIPFIYEPRIDNGHEIMDGGLCENYPFWIHLINQSDEDAARIKIGFDLIKEKEDSEGCPESIHRAANIAANTSGSFVESLLDPQVGSLPGDNSVPLAELKLLHRIANVNETRNQKTGLHDAMIDYYSNHSSFKFYPVEIPVRGRGFFWLDFNIEKTTYNGLCCRGWETAIAMLKDRSLVAANDLVTANPYKNWIFQGLLKSKGKVKGFLPSRSGLHFANNFPQVPLVQIPIGSVTIPLGDASRGLCAGMTLTVRDYFESGLLLPADTTPPSAGTLYNYIADRQIHCFDYSPTGGALRQMELMNPLLLDIEPPIAPLGLHSRAWIMVKEEWPKIKDDIDNNRLSPIALILIKSTNPHDLGKGNHQVLGYAYSLYENCVDIYVYDPNSPDDDNSILTLELGDPHSKILVTLPGYPSLNCFFRNNYSKKTPPEFSRKTCAKVAFKTFNGKYLMAENGGGKEVNATANAIGSAETFEIETTGIGSLKHGALVNIKTSNGQYVVAENGGGSIVNANRNLPRQWEKFVIERLTGKGLINNGDKIVIRACNDQYICAEGGGGGVVNANRDCQENWGIFTIVIL